MGSSKMIYFGSKINKISDSLNMLLNSYDIDFDIYFNQISNIYFDKNSFTLKPYPFITQQLKESQNFSITHNLKNIKYPCLIGNVDKKKIYNRVEKLYFQIELDTILLLDEDNKNYYIFDADIAPYLKISKSLIIDNIDNTTIITSTNSKISYDKYQLFKSNINNIFAKKSIGSNAYLDIANIINKSNLSSKNEISIYYSIKKLSILTYKMIDLSKSYVDKKFIEILQKELEIFSKVINSISYRQKSSKLYNLFYTLFLNRKELEEYVKYCFTESTYR